MRVRSLVVGVTIADIVDVLAENSNGGEEYKTVIPKTHPKHKIRSRPRAVIPSPAKRIRGHGLTK